MQPYIVIVSGSILNVSTVHLNGIWHLIWRYLSKPVLGGHYSIPRGCPLNTGFTVFGSVFFVPKSLLGIARQWSRKKIAILTLNPQDHVRILIYRARAIKRSFNPPGSYQQRHAYWQHMDGEWGTHWAFISQRRPTAILHWLSNIPIEKVTRLFSSHRHPRSG